MNNAVALIAAHCAGVNAAGSTTSARQAAPKPLPSFVLPA